MRRPLIIATVAGAVLAAGVAVGPALAATPTPGPDPSPTATCPMGGPRRAGGAQDSDRGVGPGAGMGYGMGYGRHGSGAGRGQGTGEGPGMGPGMGRGMGEGTGEGMGPGMGRGMGRWGNASAEPLAGLAKGTLTDGQKATLAGTAEEEKLAHDVYVALAASSQDARFTRIAASESRHLTEVRALMSRYGVSDPTAGKAAGHFTSASREQQYSRFVARGDDSPAAALSVGREIETADLADLAAARTGLTAPDALAVYTRLSNASTMHLRAFGGPTGS